MPAAAEAMRRIMVERARRKTRLKHGGEFKRADLSVSQVPAGKSDFHILEIDEVLGRLEENYPDTALLIKLRFFGELSENEVAQAMGISRATASRHWSFGRAWLLRELNSEDDDSSPRV